jgi:hypothetical protein
MAICLSGELVAQDSLYNQILNDLASIRATFGDTIEVLNQIKFRTPWQSGYLWIGFDTSAIQQIRNGQYHAWDSLNQQYQVTYIDTSFFDFIGFALLRFKGRLHPYRLVELYSVLPGVNVASPSGIFGDAPNIYARHSEVEMTYLFRNAWNDCPAGCIDNEYWYFVFEGNQPLLVGYWPQYQQHQPPDWWEEAKLNKAQYCNP